VTAREAAEALGMPENYLSKTLGALVRVGVLKSHRGPAGGFRLALDAGSVSLSRIVDAVDPPRKVARCLVGPGPCDPANPCTLHGRWRTIERELRSPLERTTLRDLLDTSEN
jgi:Rrf2 family transcriptional regulator, iron-sulfur cluster assembly transcription factor